MLVNYDTEIMLTRFLSLWQIPEKNEKGKYLFVHIVLEISWLLGFISSGSMVKENNKTRA